jgi:L-alanine-DL-glutamate epimerase-like enolase superfamily enzyme
MVSFGWVKPLYEATNRKLAEGFTCVKLKIETIDFDKELDLLRYIRQYFTQNRLKSG